MNAEARTKRHLVLLWSLTLAILLLLSMAFGAFAYRHVTNGGKRFPEPVSAAVIWAADAPRLVRDAFSEVYQAATGSPSSLLLIPKQGVMQSNWEHKFPAESDDGFLLLSSLSELRQQSTVRLIRISDGETIAEWVPDWNLVSNLTSDHRWAPKGNPTAIRAFHPILLGDGSIIFNTIGSLVRQPLCSSTPTWVIDHPIHHSIELSPEGNSIWVPSITEEFSVENATLRTQLRDDSLAEVSLDGKILRNLSFSQILTDNQMVAHMLGTAGHVEQLDPLHLNQITPAKNDSPFWSVGDLLISARHTSTIYLYRPSTNEVLWSKQGPWINQHSAHFSGTDKIVVFGNDVYGNPSKKQFIAEANRNHIYEYDFSTQDVSSLQSATLNALLPRTATEGRLQITSDGDFFIEETNNARIFKLTKSGDLEWSYLNSYDEDNLGAVTWSRYIEPGDMPLNADLLQDCK